MVDIEKRILVVDDEPIVRESCKRALTDAGYAVRTAGSGRDALQACRAEPFDVMLTDLRMPDMDGLEVIRAVAEEFPEVRVVVITGYPSRTSANEAAKLGIFDYLEKPLSPGRLSAATAAALARPPRDTATILPTPLPDAATPAGTELHEPEETSAVSPTPAPARTEIHELEKAGPEEVLEPTPRKTTNKTRQAVLVAIGFLGGVTVAYVIAPVHALAYLAVGTAIASGTILGLFSDAFFAKRAGSETGGESKKGRHGARGVS